VTVIPAHVTASSPATSAPFGRTVIVLTLGGLLVVGQLYVPLPMVGAMARAWSVRPGQAIWTVTAFGLAYAAGFLVTGPLSDLVGRRRVLLSGLLVLTGATAALAAAPSLPFAIGCRIVQGAGAAGFSPAALAYLGERIPPRRRPVALTCLVTAMVAATVTGQLIGQAAAGPGGWRGVIAANAVAVAALAVACRLVLLPGPDGHGRPPARGYLAALGRLASRPVLILIFLAAVTVVGGFVAAYATLQLLGPQALAQPSAMLALRAGALPALVAAPLLAPALNRVRPARRGALALAAAAGVLLILAATGGSSLAVTAGLMLLFVGAVAIVSPGLTELVGTLSGPARGAGVGLYTFALLVGASVAPPAVHALGGLGFAATLTVIAAAQAAAAILLAIADRLR
jgi:predicted MFS family arabinose efflux permease